MFWFVQFIHKNIYIFFLLAAHFRHFAFVFCFLFWKKKILTCACVVKDTIKKQNGMTPFVFLFFYRITLLLLSFLFWLFYVLPLIIKIIPSKKIKNKIAFWFTKIRRIKFNVLFYGLIAFYFLSTIWTGHFHMSLCQLPPHSRCSYSATSSTTLGEFGTELHFIIAVRVYFHHKGLQYKIVQILG